jgi:hypothetical protein
MKRRYGHCPARGDTSLTSQVRGCPFKNARQNTTTETRLKNIADCLTPALTLLHEINDAFGSSFVQLISNTTLALITAVQVTDFIIMFGQYLTHCASRM